jgi:hypothetical protein
MNDVDFCENCEEAQSKVQDSYKKGEGYKVIFIDVLDRNYESQGVLNIRKALQEVNQHPKLIGISDEEDIETTQHFDRVLIRPFSFSSIVEFIND